MKGISLLRGTISICLKDMPFHRHLSPIALFAQKTTFQLHRKSGMLKGRLK